MNTIVPFGYLIGSDNVEYDFTDLRKDKTFVLNNKQRAEEPSASCTKDLQSLSDTEFIDKYMRILENYLELKYIIESRFKSFMFNSFNDDFKCKITTSWLTKLNQGDSIELHRHQNCYYSGLLYYGEEYNESSAHLYLQNPINLEGYYKFPMHNYNLMHTDFPLVPSTGALYFFPSRLQHFSRSHIGNTRYSLAFNIVPTASFISGDSSFNYEWIK